MEEKEVRRNSNRSNGRKEGSYKNVFEMSDKAPGMALMEYIMDLLKILRLASHTEATTASGEGGTRWGW